MLRGVDWSRWQGRLGKENLRILRDRYGIECCIPGAWHGLSANPFCYGNLYDARDLGMKIATYTVVNSLSPERAYTEARNLVGDLWPVLSFVAVDVEVPTTEDTVNACAALIERDGLRAPIYTGDWFTGFWATQLGHVPKIMSRPRWRARYFNSLSPDNWPTSLDQQGATIHPQWPTVGWQFRGTLADWPGGPTLDWNIFDREWLEGGDMTPDEVKAIVDARIVELVSQAETLLQGDLVHASGSDEIWLIDRLGRPSEGLVRRHVTARAWPKTQGAVKEVSALALLAFPEGPEVDIP